MRSTPPMLDDALASDALRGGREETAEAVSSL